MNVALWATTNARIHWPTLIAFPFRRPRPSESRCNPPGRASVARPYDFQLRRSAVVHPSVSVAQMPQVAPPPEEFNFASYVMDLNNARGDTASPIDTVEFDDLLVQGDGDYAGAVSHRWLYSSGSTGKTKGVVDTHSNLYWTNELYAKRILGLTQQDRIFSAAKLFFAYGLGNALTFPLSVGASSVLMVERSTPEAVYINNGTTGKPVPGYDVELRDESGDPTQQGTIGDLLVKSPSCTLRYWNDRSKSRESFHGPWLRAGDKFLHASWVVRSLVPISINTIR